MVSWLIGGRLLSPARRDVGPPPEGLETVEFTLQSKSGATIAGWFLPNEKATASVVLCHGVRGCRGSMVSRAKLLHAAGYAIVMIDLQAHGESTGESISVGHLERHDVEAAVGFARENNAGHKIAVVGQSLGGASTVLANELRLDAVVLEAVFPSLRQAVHNRVAARFGPLADVPTWSLLVQFPLRLGFSADEISPIERIAGLACPTLVLCGSEDPHTPLSESQALFDAACEPKQMVVFDGAGHTDFLKFDEALYSRTVVSFLDRHLTE